MTSLWKSMTKRKHGRCTKAISAGDSQAHCQGPYAEEPQQERRHSHIFGLHALHERCNVNNHHVPFSRLMREASITSKKSGETTISAKSIRRVTEGVGVLAFDNEIHMIPGIGETRGKTASFILFSFHLCLSHQYEALKHRI
ncbi:hypothetical protein CIHG_04365 [Coccidioides immitis H538.4]|uniref:Uncharacterized protein n=3 Tax=Coccidioides immitis TaxID=5501 RepID=A0A0J8R7P8_COCIT|nr:hypothetical protein CIRG_09299 [Coccidioides immitis RMSCC 2394]KMU81034.1 hypothetical protein CISG_02414 [Coccidioides immitis RMSCC 3703]KMU86577.1 hypothetical protein CIHG_04365 [Coccidioides immitis H538.4]